MHQHTTAPPATDVPTAVETCVPRPDAPESGHTAERAGDRARTSPCAPGAPRLESAVPAVIGAVASP